MKYVRLISKRNPFYEITSEFVDVIEPYVFSNIPKIEQFVFFLERIFKKTIMNPKLKRINHDVLLTNDSTSPRQIEFIRKHNPSLRIIMSYGNPVLNAKYKPTDYDGLDVIFASFQKSDCDKYNLNYIPTTFNAKLPIKEHAKHFDAVFFGKDKGRMELIKQVNNAIQMFGYSTYIHITTDERKVFISKGYKHPIKYKKMLSYYQSCNAIIDIQQAFQDGLDIRAIAAVLMDKKLIINNPKIVNETFYNKNNIFVLGVDPIEKIGDFFKTPFIPYDQAIKDFYSLERRFKQLDKILNESKKWKPFLRCWCQRKYLFADGT